MKFLCVSSLITLMRAPMSIFVKLRVMKSFLALLFLGLAFPSDGAGAAAGSCGSSFWAYTRGAHTSPIRSSRAALFFTQILQKKNRPQRRGDDSNSKHETRD